MKDVYRMLIIGFGAGLITLGFVGIALSNRVEIQKRQEWVWVAQRAGTSVASFTLNLSSGGYMLGVSVWVHNYAEGLYSISDASGNQVVIVRLANTDQSSEWKYSDGYFHLVDSGYYTFELFNATFSSVRSTAQSFQRRNVNECLYPYRSFFWVEVFSLVVGVPFVVVGLASLLTAKP